MRLINNVSLQFEIIETRTNNMFELATQEEVDKLGTSGAGGYVHTIPKYLLFIFFAKYHE